MNRLRLSNLGVWIPRTTPLRINRPPPAPASPSFDTLATLPTSSSLQAPIFTAGARIGAPNAAATPTQLDVEPSKEGHKRYLGVSLPMKPVPPGPEECCQSGCAVCVYDLYMEDVQHFHEELSEARKAVLHKIGSQGLVVKEEDWPTELGEMEKPGGGVDPKVLAEKELERTRKSLDPGLRAFLEMEARMKKKQQEREAAAKVVV